MTPYAEEDYLMLSGIQHYVFCKRQWALIHIEKQWDENARTMEGNVMHENAHNIAFTESRKQTICSRAMPIHSKSMGVSGECDVVEFVRDDTNGITLYGRDGKYLVCPVEYKRGKPKAGEEDIYQLVAQAICLEEMFCCTIDTGYLYYGETRHRLKVDITNERKENVKKAFRDMHRMFSMQHTPKAKRTKSCNACSLKNICLPTLSEQRSVKQYIDNFITGDK